MTNTRDLYTYLFSSLLLPAWERARGRDTLAVLRDLQRSQWLSTDELLARQQEALRVLCRHAHARVPAYRRRMQEAGVDPGRLQLAELPRLPLLTRQEVREDSASFLAAPDGDDVLLTKSTSGTTGSPFRFQYSARSEIWRQAIKLRAYGWAGYVPGQRTLHYWGPPAVAPVGVKKHKVAVDRALRREVYIDCARQGEADLQRAVETLRQLRPQVLIGYTQATVELGRFINQRGLRDWPAMHVLCGAERLFGHDRPVLEEAFSQPGGVYETYGCREFMLLASECEQHDGLHVSMENLIVEVVDDAGQPVAAGQSGQVAVTDLHNFGMPLIRYLTGDVAQAAAPAHSGARGCACGRGLVRIANLEGRQADLLIGHDGRPVTGMIVPALFAAQGGKVRQFQLIQHRDRSLHLKLVPGPEFAAALIGTLERQLHSYFGDLPLTVETCGDIPVLPSGKRRYVVRET